MNAEDVIAGRATWAVDCGDCLPWLKSLPEKSVRLCVSSPPYFGLRDYGTGEWEGGDPKCDHRPSSHQVQGATSQINGRGSVAASRSDALREVSCPRCGAVRINDFQIGLESSPDEYVEKLVRVFRRVRRVLTDDGTFWMNLGDSYNAAGRNGHGTRIGRKQGTNRASANGADSNRSNDAELKPKDLLGIPWRVALALQADGWYLRSDIIWDAPNRMPESVTDRPTQSHEYVFLLAKSEKYYYDADAIKEPAISTGGGASFGKQNHNATGTGAQSRTYDRPDYEWKNKRSVWAIPTKSFHGAHFAVMPEALVRPCILAGSAPGDVVLDPFAGSGTVLRVAVSHRRRAIGVELNPDYVALARKRVGGATVGLI